MKIDDGEQHWINLSGKKHNDAGMVFWDYTLDHPAPTSAREALDLAWEVAHPVKDGQRIPSGTRLLDRLDRNDFSVYTALVGFTISGRESLNIRTLDPLPEPEPDWLDAPAVIAVCNDVMDRSVFVREGDNWWVSKNHAAETRDLRDVTPLYPLNEGTENGTTAPKGYNPYANEHKEKK